MRREDWIQELYYKELSDKSKSNNNSGKNVSSKKEISRTQNKLKSGRRSIDS